MKEQLIDGLVERLKEALGEDLISVVLHGSAAAGDYQEKVSDLNILCVLTRIDVAELEKAYKPTDWWLKKKQPAPIFLSREEIENGHDAFAIEFLDIRAAYKFLHGEDVVAGIEVEPSHHRHQVEHELRSRLLRLRERYLVLQKDRRELTRLMVDSVPTFATLFRHALILSGDSPPVKKREIFRAAAGRFQLSEKPFEALMDYREGTQRLDDREIRPIFEDYLKQITKVAEHVDQL